MIEERLEKLIVNFFEDRLRKPVLRKMPQIHNAGDFDKRRLRFKEIHKCNKLNCHVGLIVFCTSMRI